jgi:hypothetical protein
VLVDAPDDQPQPGPDQQNDTLGDELVIKGSESVGSINDLH